MSRLRYVYVISCSALVRAEESFLDVIIIKKAYYVTNGLVVSGNGTLPMSAPRAGTVMGSAGGLGSTRRPWRRKFVVSGDAYHVHL